MMGLGKATIARRIAGFVAISVATLFATVPPAQAQAQFEPLELAIMPGVVMPARVWYTAAHAQAVTDLGRQRLNGEVRRVTTTISMNRGSAGQQQLLATQRIIMEFDASGNLTRVAGREGDLEKDAQVISFENRYVTIAGKRLLESSQITRRSHDAKEEQRGIAGPSYEYGPDARLLKVTMRLPSPGSLVFERSDGGALERLVIEEDGVKRTLRYGTKGLLDRSEASGNPSSERGPMFRREGDKVLWESPEGRRFATLEFDERGGLRRWVMDYGGERTMEQSYEFDKNDNWTIMSTWLVEQEKNGGEPVRTMIRRATREIEYAD